MPGEYEIKVSYDFETPEGEVETFQDSFYVEVLDEWLVDEEAYVTGIKIKALPEKKTYRVDDDIDLEGLVVVAKLRGMDTGWYLAADGNWYYLEVSE